MSLIIVEAAMPDGYRMVMMSPTNVKVSLLGKVRQVEEGYKTHRMSGWFPACQM